MNLIPIRLFQGDLIFPDEKPNVKKTQTNEKLLMKNNSSQTDCVFKKTRETGIQTYAEVLKQKIFKETKSMIFHPAEDNKNTH